MIGTAAGLAAAGLALASCTATNGTASQTSPKHETSARVETDRTVYEAIDGDLHRLATIDTDENVHYME